MVILIKLFLGMLLFLLVARALLRLALWLVPKKPLPEQRYSPKPPLIREQDIVEGEFKELKK